MRKLLTLERPDRGLRGHALRTRFRQVNRIRPHERLPRIIL